MKTICFVKQDATIRIYKQAKALKLTKKYRLILICEKCDYYLQKDIFDEIIFYGFLENKKNNLLTRILNFGFNKLFKFGEMNLKRLSKDIDVDLYHCHAEPNSIPRIIMENSRVPVLFDSQDFSGISYGIENLDEKTKDDEKYCFENADGIVRKGTQFEIDYYRQNGYNIECPEFQWLDYCDEDLFANINIKKLSEDDYEYHLVHTGTISTDPVNDAFKYLIPLAKILAKQKIHLHIYPNPLEYDNAREYHELDRNVEYFHFHKPVPYTILSEEVSKYDYGILILKQVNSERANMNKFKVGQGNKTFSYFEAGLPEISSDFLLNNNKLIIDYGLGFIVNEADLNNLDKLLNNADYDKLRNNVLKARNELSLKNRVHDLEDFYSLILDSKLK